MSKWFLLVKTPAFFDVTFLSLARHKKGRMIHTANLATPKRVQRSAYHVSSGRLVGLVLRIHGNFMFAKHQGHVYVDVRFECLAFITAHS